MQPNHDSALDALSAAQRRIVERLARGVHVSRNILLNLFLSLLASLQAPIIMMSQNRQAAKDRLDAEHDYEVNLKAEIEIRTLHEKLDQLRDQKWTDLVALQDEQIRMLERLLEQSRR
jgi:uncharacterized membrane protein